MNKNPPKPHTGTANVNPPGSKGEQVQNHPPKNDNNMVQQPSGQRGAQAEVVAPEGKKATPPTVSPIDSLLQDIGWDTKPLVLLAAGTLVFLLFWKMA